jgi:hypothetical protein
MAQKKQIQVVHDLRDDESSGQRSRIGKGTVRYGMTRCRNQINKNPHISFKVTVTLLQFKWPNQCLDSSCRGLLSIHIRRTKSRAFCALVRTATQSSVNRPNCQLIVCCSTQISPTGQTILCRVRIRNSTYLPYQAICLCTWAHHPVLGDSYT